MFLRLLVPFVTCALFTALAAADDAKSARSYPLPQFGKLELTMAADWKDQVQQPPQGLPPTITLSPAKGNAFQVLVTPMWAVRPGVTVPGKEEIRRLVQRAADDAKSQAVEKTIPVRELAGPAGTGYYFSATDKSPKPGEFKYMTQGTIRVGEIALMFTALTNDGAGTALPSALEMLRNAKHIPRTP